MAAILSQPQVNVLNTDFYVPVMYFVMLNKLLLCLFHLAGSTLAVATLSPFPSSSSSH